MFNRSLRSLGLSLIASVCALSAACTAPQSGQPAGEAPPSSPSPTSAPGALQAAHEAYLGGDFIAVGERIHDVLLDPSSGELAKDNALELLERSFAAQNGKLPARFALPDQIGGMELGLMKGQAAHGEYRALYLFVRVRAGLASRVTNITVRHLPGDLLLDKASGRGKIKLRHDKPGFEDIVLEAINVESLPADGVFSIRVEIDGAPVMDSWVLGSKLVATTTPEIASPAPSESLADENPTVRWTPFHSPEHAPFEDRTLSVYVHDPKANKAAWDLWTDRPGDLAVLRIGDHDGTAKTKLAPGSYWLAFTAGENRSFGPVTLARKSQAGLPFNVVK
jgi:hypothetical protein